MTTISLKRAGWILILAGLVGAGITAVDIIGIYTSAEPIGTWKVDSGATLAANQTQISRQLEGIEAEARKKLEDIGRRLPYRITKGTIDLKPHKFEGIAEARKKLEDIYRSIEGTIEFKPDESFVSTTVLDGREMTMRGTWEIDANKITTRAESPDGEQVMTGTLQEGSLKLTSGGDQYLVLRRE